MNRKLQVFISSTYRDLINERQTAVHAVLDAGHIPAGMELFAAGDETQLAVIKRWIDESDVYMLILGARYGTVEVNSGKSYTHLEYEYALEKRKPIFAVYLADAPFKERVRALAEELATEDRKGYGAFRDLVKTKLCSEFSDSRDITIAVLKTLAEFSRKPELQNAGWVRGRDVPDTSALATENARLLTEVTRLASEAKALTAERDSLRSKRPASPEPAALAFRSNAYWNDVTNEGPFCSRCWDAERKLIRLTLTESMHPKCANCKEYFPSS